MGNGDRSELTCTRSTSSDLLKRVRGRDADAWRLLVRRYAPLVGGWLKRAGLQPADAGEVLQNVFQAVARGIDGFHSENPGDSFRGWLHGITRYKLADHFRQAQAEPAGVGGSTMVHLLEQLPEPEDSPSRDLAGEHLQLLRYRAMELVQAELKPRTWQIFWQVQGEGASTSEVAGRFGISPSAVRLAKSRVMRRLREQLEELLKEA